VQPPSAHILLVAFLPFGGRRRNESAQALRALGLSRAQRDRVRALLLPVSWRRGLARLGRALARPGLAAVVLTGEAGGRGVVTPEAWARNRAGAAKDVDGRRAPSALLERRGPARRKATWDAGDVVRVLRRARVPARVSRDAGAYLCNAAFFLALGRARSSRPPLPTAFVHLPVPRAGDREALSARRLAAAVRAVVSEAVRRWAPGDGGPNPAPRGRGPRRGASRRPRPRPRPRS
jgi:pyroglutamyl-peptidase